MVVSWARRPAARSGTILMMDARPGDPREKKRVRGRGGIAVLALLLAAATASGQPSSERRQLTANKALVLDFFARRADRRALVARDFVDHNPRPGGLVRLLSEAAQPSPLTGRTVELMVAEGDSVGVVWKQARPDPDAPPPATYDAFTFDVFRLRAGLVVEHWDNATKTPTVPCEEIECRPLLTTASLPPVPPSTRDGLAANKKVAIDNFQFPGSREERARIFLTEDYVQHNPRFLKMDRITGARGREAWLKASGAAQGRPLVNLGGISLRNLPVIVMAEGDLVLLVYKGVLPDPDVPSNTYEAFAFEAYRVRDGMLAEHWDQVTLTPGWTK
jgi:predicted SnoaL-like aldol condensation-catalyzing enzyme